MTRAEQRLNSNHGRLILAARAMPERLRHARLPGSTRTPRDVLAHVLAWQEEALRHLRCPEAPWPGQRGLDAWDAAALDRLRQVGWDDLVASLEANHRDLRRHVGEDPPRWLGRWTYWHYIRHTRGLLAFAHSSTTTVAPIAAQS